MNKTIIIHPGTGKTATSSIRNAIYDKRNEELLSKYNIEVFEKWFLQTNFRLYLAFCDEIDNKLKELDNLSTTMIDANSKAVKKELTDMLSNNNTLLISSEYFCRFNENEVRNLKNFIEENCAYPIDFKIVFFIIFLGI